MAETETLQKLMTGEELLETSDVGRCELVNGEIVRMSPASGRHGEVAIAIGSLLRHYVKSQALGKTYAAETGFYVRKNPDTVRAPDAMFISNERVAKVSDPNQFLDVAPDLAVEVLSPNDTWSEVETKIAEYFSAGVRLIWIVDPEQETITVYRPEGERSRLTETDCLKGEDVLPDFSVEVSEIFE